MDYVTTVSESQSSYLAPTGFFTLPYVQKAPLALALERIQECRLLADYKFKTPILDIGCGDGIFGKIIFDSKIDYGLDPNTTEIARAKEIDSYKNYLNEFGDKISLPSNSMETVISNSVLEHIPDLEAVLKEIHRVVKSGGRIYFTIPTADFEKYSLVYTVLNFLKLSTYADKFSKFYNGFWAHYHAYTPEDWKSMFERNGFSVVSSTRYCSPLSCFIHDSLVPVALPSFFTRKFLNRWFVFPELRKAISKPLAWFCDRVLLPKTSPHPKGGLILFVLTKA